ncbi:MULTISPECIES: hypothetical protein [Micromonospora]|uniref:Uncharacterized protein n=1 Tax=Micromonospora maris TaxID=1003110 RepID=A0A9X0I652_9ACTN|nr:MULTISPECIES: hypothetical protein [Micromonospora]AEB42052.1 hypothetical protein VAB18032_04630 [Micromonospora maris AB-18-032]KUJ47587.1 hypothetical protein ADL17_00135 [Micromonospora maris]RUL91546.1 hypothetical protein EG812_19735 [Verrucosispora sp. FIM060022]
MLTFVATSILYVCGFIFLYGVIRLAVRHALEDVEMRRVQAQRAEEMAAARDRALLQKHGFLSNNG